MAIPATDLTATGIVTPPSPGTTGTTFTVTAGTGLWYPTTFPFYATLWNPQTMPNKSNAEIVEVTSISTDTFTIVRAQRGTTAQDVLVNWSVACGVYVEDLDNLVQNLTTSNLSATADITGSQLSATADIAGSQLSASAGITSSQLASSGLNLPPAMYNPYKSFVYLSASWTAGAGLQYVPFDTAIFDTSSNFTLSATSGDAYFTAPIDGFYFFSAVAQSNGGSVVSLFYSNIINTTTNPSNNFLRGQDNGGTTGPSNLMATGILYCNAGDKVMLQIYIGTASTSNVFGNSTTNSGTYFNSFLVCAT